MKKNKLQSIIQKIVMTNCFIDLFVHLRNIEYLLYAY